MKELSLDNEVFVAFAWYGVLIILKMLLISISILCTRVLTKTFANEEDVRSFGSSKMLKDKPVVTTHPTVERLRRAHMNDIENIIPFFLIGLIFVLTNPDFNTAQLYFRIFFGVRVAHTISYLFKIPQPSRFVFFLSGYVVTILMGYHVLEKLGLKDLF